MRHLRRVVLTALLAAAASSLASAQSAPPAAADILRGTVLFLDPAAGALVQTSRGVVTVPPPAGAALIPGDRVEARGVVAEQDGESILTNAVILQRAAGTVPSPTPTTPAGLGADGSNWVELETVIQDAVAQNGRLELRLPSPVWPVTAGATLGEIDPQQLIDARVRLRGVRRTIRSPQGVVTGVRLIAVPLSPDDVLTAAPASPFERPLVTAAELRQIATQQSSEHRVRVRGTVLMRHAAFVPGRRVIQLQDETAGVTTEVFSDTGIADGDVIEVSGFPSLFFGTPILAGGVARREGPGTLPTPITVTPQELLAGTIPQTFVHMRATFAEASTPAGAEMLTFDVDGTLVNAYLFSAPGQAPAPMLARGTIVELTGVYQVVAGLDGQPTIVMTLPGPQAIVVTQRPSWWTPGRAAAAALVGVAALAAVIAWVLVLNARVRSRTLALEEQYRRTAALQRRWTDLVASASDVILTWDLQGRILSANRAAETLTGLTEAAMSERSLHDLTLPESAAALGALLVPPGETSAPSSGVIEMRDADGQSVPVDMSVQPMFDDDHAHIGYLGIGRNVAVQRRAERVLRAARDAAEDASRAKSEFLANMSHEIRTPMNGIIGMTELALTTNLTEAQREYMQTVKASGESLLGLLNSILDFSKIESRKLELESVPFALRDLIAETLKPLAFKADEKAVELLCEIAPNTPDGLVGDPLRLRQVVTNLLSNALKFTDRGHVLLSIREERRAEGCTRLQFSVTDTGPGIPADKQASIFEPFSQADGSTTRRYGGTGLGLAISATLVRLMGGRIWVDSTMGAGSTFHFTAGFDVTTSVEPAAVEPLLANLPVLVVDDNAINRRIFAEQLARWGMKASLADGGLAAIAALDAAAAAGEPYLLVLLDANMPEIDGFAVAEHIHGRQALAGATIMMLTSAGRYGDADRCRALNIAAYLTKPIAPKHLFEAICRVVGRGRAQAIALTRPTRPIVPAETTSRRRVLLAEDNLVNQRVAIGLLTKRGHDVTLAVNGREALEALERATFDIVLMDLQMPEMGGLEATAAIRQREASTGQHVRIVAMTAHAMNGDREQCLAAGMDGYLSKPVNPAMLYAVVEMDHEQMPGPAAAPPPARPRESVDAAALRERLAGDEALFGEVIEAFLEDCPVRLAEIKAAMDRRDTDGLRRAAHALKGAAGNLSATALFEAAERLERASTARAEAWQAAWRELSIEASNVLDSLRRFEPARQGVRHANVPPRG